MRYTDTQNDPDLCAAGSVPSTGRRSTERRGCAPRPTQNGCHGAWHSKNRDGNDGSPIRRGWVSSKSASCLRQIRQFGVRRRLFLDDPEAWRSRAARKSARNEPSGSFVGRGLGMLPRKAKGLV